MVIWVWTGGRPSQGAAHLSCQPGFKRMTLGKGVKNGDTIINWGVGDDSKFPELEANFALLNCPDAVFRAINKRKAFEIWSGQHVATVPWTQNKAVAQEWQDAGHVVVVRNILTGHEGNGIVIVKWGEKLPDAPLYTKYIDKIKEYRVHASRLCALVAHRKIKDPKLAEGPKDWYVRSYANGFIYQRNNIPASAKRDALAVQAVSVLGLDFGAVDIIEDKGGNFYVLEVNTAPGIEGQCIPLYAGALKDLAHDAHAQA